MNLLRQQFQLSSFWELNKCYLFRLDREYKYIFAILAQGFLSQVGIFSSISGFVESFVLNFVPSRFRTLLKVLLRYQSWQLQVELIRCC